MEKKKRKKKNKGREGKKIKDNGKHWFEKVNQGNQDDKWQWLNDTGVDNLDVVSSQGGPWRGKEGILEGRNL